ncbi:MAG: HAMP domain-containing sensor histidine kinase [Actinomycetota bacterium]
MAEATGPRSVDRELRSLRLRLAASGFVAAYGMVLILLAVVLTSEEQIDQVATTTTGDEPTPTIETIEETGGLETDPAILLTAAALAPVAAAMSWWWSGRVVRPVARSMTLQQHLIEETSHELRTPLSILTTNAEVLLADPEPTLDGYRRGLERSAEVAERMRRAIESLLVDARGRARVIDRRPTDLARLARSAVDDLRPIAAEAGVELDVVADGPVRARADGPSVERAITNLVANGIRHAPPGSVVVTSVGPVTGSSPAQVEISVTDAGPGIAPGDQPAVFERYWRGDDPEPDEPAGADGVGLGLAIVRQVAVAHGGGVEVESPVADGRGTRLRLRLAA